MPDQERTSEMGGAKDTGGDEGKGNVAAGKSLLGEAEQGRILRTGLRPKRRPERTPATGIWMVGLNKTAQAEREVSGLK